MIALPQVVEDQLYADAKAFLEAKTKAEREAINMKIHVMAQDFVPTDRHRDMFLEHLLDIMTNVRSSMEPVKKKKKKKVTVVVL